MTRRLRLVSNGVIVCIRSTDNDGRIAGYIKFDSTPDDAEERSRFLWDELQKSVVLNGLELETSRKPELRKVTPDGKQIKRITVTYKSVYNINVRTTKINKDKIQKIEEIFANLHLDDELKEVGCYLMEERKIGGDAADFFLSWINFNKKYCVCNNTRNECRRIKKYINDLDDTDLSLLHARHVGLFEALKQANIVDRHGNSRSKALQQVLDSDSKKEIVKKATLCVYELRNRFAHEGTFNFNNITHAATFIRELTYLELYVKYKI